MPVSKTSLHSKPVLLYLIKARITFEAVSKTFDFDTKNMPVAFAELIPAIIKRMEAYLVYLNESLIFLALFFNKVIEYDKEKVSLSYAAKKDSFTKHNA